MTLGEFKDEIEGAPVELHELADQIVAQLDTNDITAGDLIAAAQTYLDAKHALETELQAVGIEEG